MTLNKIKGLVSKLSVAVMKPFSFNGIEAEINYAARAKHSGSWRVQTHIHPWYEFNYVSKGSVYTTIADKEFLVTEGQSYLIPPGVSHSHRNNKAGDDGICIRFSLNNTNKNLDIRNITDCLGEAFPATFDSKIEELSLNGGLFGIQAEFTAWLMGIYDNLHNRSAALPATARNTLSSQVILYMEEYSAHKISVQDIAAALNLSYRSLSRKFKAETGITITEQLTKIRLNGAKILLTTTNKPIHDIAVTVGYDNEFYFSKVFKQNEKITPSYYRKKYYPLSKKV